MGQYWLPVSLDRREFVDPHKLAAGPKLREQAGSWPGTGAALVVLCAAMPEARGGGDFAPHPAVGRWAGDRIALVGDYAADADLPSEFEASTIYRKCRAGEWSDVTAMACEAIEREFAGEFVGDGRRRWVAGHDQPPAVRLLAPDVVIVGRTSPKESP